MPLGWLREGGTERVQSIIEKLWNGLTEFCREINMFHDDDLFSVELQSGHARRSHPTEHPLSNAALSS